MTSDSDYVTTQPSVVKVSQDSADVGIPLVVQRNRFGNREFKHFRHFYIPGTESLGTGRRQYSAYAPNKAKFALWNGHEFEVVWGTVQVSTEFYSVSFQWAHEPAGPIEYVTHMYYPIDPRIIEGDVKGAKVPYPNETNTGWLFRHTQEGTHHDYELQLLAAIDGVVQPYFRQILVDGLMAGEDAQPAINNRFKRLSEFYGAVIVKARAAARSVYLGEREQSAHPREGWLDRDITNAIAAVEADWTGTKDTALSDIAGAIRYLKGSLAMPATETRWDRDARLKREAAAKAAAESGD